MILLTGTIFLLTLGAAFSTQLQPSNNGSNCELIQSKLDILEFRFTELFVQLKEQAEGFLISQQRLESGQQQLNRIVERHERKYIQLVESMEDSFGNNVSIISDQSRRILERQTICSNRDLIRNSIMELRPKNVAFKPLVGSTDTPPDCSEKMKKTSGTCKMQLHSEKVVVYLEQQRFGGSWMAVLQRFDGSEDFNRNWTDYRNGFGTVGQEFWFGLERLHLLTKSGSYELLIELEDFTGNYRYARYDGFSVGPEADHYPLKELGTYSGTAGDSFTEHRGATFSASDEGLRTACQDEFSGGWWYRKDRCYDVHLTGRWEQSNWWTSIIWKKFGSPENLSLKFARMMIRKK